MVALPGPEAGTGAPEGETSLRIRPIVVLGGLGLCGGLLLLAGGGLLLLILGRSSRRSVAPVAPWSALPTGPAPSAAVPAVPQPLPTMQSYGALLAPGRPPILLASGKLSIGRSAGNDLVLDSALVSRSHAHLECAAGHCAVEDLGSANGTYLNDRRVSRASLSAGDRLRLGDVELIYQAGAVQPAGAWLEEGGRRHPLSLAGLSLGRSHENDVVLADDRASRHHARVDLQEGAWVILDLGSANGTFVNGERVRQQVLRPGDEIRIGDTLFHFRKG